MSHIGPTAETRQQALRRVATALGARSIYQSWPDFERDQQTRAEAEALLCFVTGLNRTALILGFGEPLTGTELASLDVALKARLRNQPLAYITGSVEFYGNIFRVSPNCLIPRPDTEVLVDAAVNWITKSAPIANVYDLGCGSGAIGISIALACREVSVRCIDISPVAAEIAEENRACLNAEKVVIEVKDGLQDLRHLANLAEQVDKPNLLVSNPPYIPSEDVMKLDADVREFEPHLALDGGADGLNYYRQLALFGDSIFGSGPAAFFWEVGMNQAAAAGDLCVGPQWAGWEIGTIRDLRGVERVVFGIRK